MTDYAWDTTQGGPLTATEPAPTTGAYASFNYDAANRLLSTSATTLTYDPAHRLI